MGIITKGMGAVLTKFKAKPKKFDPAGDIKKEKIRKEYKKAAAVGVAGAGIVTAGVKKIKNIIEQDYGKDK
jgi:hypothetical protein|tara:strand:- start:260 stop:472 length:213 start_codon:yes stop_codon:yes gene_type:complete